MPELPEVETTSKGLQILVNHKITNIKIYSTKLRYIIPKNTTKVLKNNKIKRIYRIGKYILLDLLENNTLVIHLGMSGRLKVLKQTKIKKDKHDHLIFKTKNHFFVFNDTRKFGFIDIIKTNEQHNTKYIKILGKDALSKNLNEKYLHYKFKRLTTSIKQTLLNQKIISGIGNIYACEILFDAKISPLTKTCSLNLSEIKQIIKSTRKILIKAINSGGSSLKDYIAVDGTLGNFQKKFKVYDREGEIIKGHRIIRIRQNGRSTFFCPNIQN